MAIDAALFCAAFFPVTRLLKGVWLMAPADHRWRHGLFVFDPLCLAFLLLIVAYYIALEALGGTAGKRLLGLRIIDAAGRPPGLRASVIRNALRIVDSLPVGYVLGALLVATSAERTRLGDRLAGTRVIHHPHR
jgi:uncharacterized RDD family membrane protein YckC